MEMNKAENRHTELQSHRMIIIQQEHMELVNLDLWHKLMNQVIGKDNKLMIILI